MSSGWRSSRGVIVPAVNCSTSGGARWLCGLETFHEAREQQFLQRETVMVVRLLGIFQSPKRRLNPL